MRHFIKRAFSGSAIVGCLLLGFCATATDQISFDESLPISADLCGPACGKLFFNLVF